MDKYKSTPEQQHAEVQENLNDLGAKTVRVDDRLSVTSYAKTDITILHDSKTGQSSMEDHSQSRQQSRR
jgi:hypothetical protein